MPFVDAASCRPLCHQPIRGTVEFQVPRAATDVRLVILGFGQKGNNAVRDPGNDPEPAFASR
jgi:hypothetical protein